MKKIIIRLTSITLSIISLFVLIGCNKKEEEDKSSEQVGITEVDPKEGTPEVQEEPDPEFEYNQESN